MQESDHADGVPVSRGSSERVHDVRSDNKGDRCPNSTARPGVIAVKRSRPIKAKLALTARTGTNDAHISGLPDRVPAWLAEHGRVRCAYPPAVP